MEDKKTIIDKVKELIFAEEIAPEEVSELIDVKDINGVILRVPALEVDSPVMVISEDGEAIAEDGTYELEDGMSLVIVEGMISEIIEATEVEDVVEEEVEEVELEVETEVESETEIPSIESTMARKNAELEEKIASLLAKFEIMEVKLSELSKAPAEEEIKLSKVGKQERKEIPRSFLGRK